MIRRLLPVALVILLFGSSEVFAQTKRVEITPSIGYTFSEGVNVSPVTDSGSMLTYDSVGYDSALSYGVSVDVFATEGFSIGFLWSRQSSDLTGGIVGGGKTTFTDMDVNNYHGIFGYSFRGEDARVRPFFFGGLGATQYDFDQIGNFDVSGQTKFSTTWGGGVKAYASDHIGVRLMGRWTPTYIKTDPAGIWCSPYWPWGCWVVGDSDYSHQFEMSAGLIIRF